MAKTEPTTRDILDALLGFKEAVEMQFVRINKRFDGIDRRFEDFEMRMNRRFDRLDVRFDVMDRRVSALEAG